MSQPQSGSTLGEIFKKHERERNPVTRSVYRDILAKRLDAIERVHNRWIEKAMEGGE